MKNVLACQSTAKMVYFAIKTCGDEKRTRIFISRSRVRVFEEEGGAVTFQNLKKNVDLFMTCTDIQYVYSYVHCRKSSSSFF